MLHNSNGANIYVVDGKSWIVGEHKISMWSGSKCNESKCNESKCNESKCNESKCNKLKEHDKTEVIESKDVIELVVDKTEVNKTDN